MKCPKCQYIGFDGQSRCRNCGYDLSLTATLESTPPAGRPEPGPAADEIARPRGEPSAREQARAAIQRRAGTRTPAPDFDLPLFATPGADDRPAVAPPARPPLAVRRTTGDGPRARAVAAAVATPPPQPSPVASGAGQTPPAEVDPRLDLPLTRPGPDASPAAEPDLALRIAVPAVPAVPAAADPQEPPLSMDPPTVRLEAPPLVARRRDAPSADADRVPGESGSPAQRREEGLAPAGGAEPTAAAGAVGGAAETVADADDPGLGARAAAGLLDIVLLAVLDGLVVLATLRVLGLPVAAVDRLPLAPLAAFFAVLAAGYLTMCTVLAGQTVGKRLFGLRVVEPEGRPVRFGHAVVRAVLQVLTVPLLGLGFLPALLGADRRTLYDRLAGTEVVRLRS
jgi:uncharacterized RDD family membrane protein YckC